MAMENAKRSAARAAAALIEDGMVVGLGTGSTALFFIESLVEKKRKGLKIQAVPSSIKSLQLAREGDIPILDNPVSIDITVDGADEIDPQKQMIKGGGGALLREKIIAAMSEEMVVIVDETKLVSKLGSRPLPVEIVPFGYKATLSHLNHLGFEGSLRTIDDGKIYITDNGNYIYDVILDPKTVRPSSDHDLMIQIPGVVETGFFLNLAGRVIVGFQDGRVVVQ